MNVTGYHNNTVWASGIMDTNKQCSWLFNELKKYGYFIKNGSRPSQQNAIFRWKYVLRVQWVGHINRSVLLKSVVIGYLLHWLYKWTSSICDSTPFNMPSFSNYFYIYACYSNERRMFVKNQFLDNNPPKQFLCNYQFISF